MFNATTLIYKIGGIPKDYASLPFGRQLDYAYIIGDFKNAPTTKTIHLSQKRQSYKKAIKEFKALYKPSSFYVPPFGAEKYNYFDDSFIVYYKQL